MAEYIEREVAIEMFEQAFDNNWEVSGTLDRIRAIPAADVVQVVRCRDCIYWEPASPTRTSGNCNRSFDIPAWATDFCSYGKRKDGGQEDETHL